MSVIIPLFNRDDLTERCLAAIERHTPEVEVVLVDNASTDSTRHRDVAVRNDTNLGFARACNQGAEAATGDTLVFLNNDTEVHAGWLDPLEQALGQYDIAGSRLVYPDGTLQHAGIVVDFTQQPGLEARGVQTDEPSREVDAVTGACLAIMADDFDRLGGFDEGFWNGYEDVDLCLRAGPVWYCADSTVTHLESQSGPERWTAVRENVMRLRAKWMVR